MKGLIYFFRPEQDGTHFLAFSSTHFLMLFFLFFGAVLLYQTKEKLRQSPRLQRWVRGGFLFVLLVQQLGFLVFYFLIAHQGIREGLPLYTCRFAVYGAIVALLFSSHSAKTIAIDWGLVGGLIAMANPDFAPYAWPHWTNLNYVLTHFAVFWVALYFLWVEEYSFRYEGVKSLLFWTNCVLLLGLVVNRVGGGNYAYLAKSPIFPHLFAGFNSRVYAILVIVLYNLAGGLIHFGLTRLQQKRKKLPNLRQNG